MSARAASCPNCGGEVAFRAGSSLVTVCPNCRSAVSRKGVKLESIGTVAELVPTSSPFKVGMSGRPKNGWKPFRIVGRLQLSTGQGTWDEWHVSFDDGQYGWLAEAQGTFYLLKAMSTPQAPEMDQLSPGQVLDLAPHGRYTVTDRREARYVSAEGDLPFVAPPGSLFQYADLSGADGGFATLDYGDDPGVDSFFAGVTVPLESLGIAGLVGWKDRKTSAKAASLNCTNCGGPIALKDPSSTVRIACPYCGSVLDASKEGGKFEILQKLTRVAFRPLLPLGAEGTLQGKPYVILGCVLKSCVVDGTTYYWREYLLKETKTEAYHFLSESNGHWTLLEPIPAGEIVKEALFATAKGTRYKLFQTTTARVNAVLGEFYWEVAAGETTEAADFVAPPRMLSEERNDKEVAWTEGAYLPKEELETGFALKNPLPPPEGVGSNQPWPRAPEAAVVGKTWKWLALAAVVLFTLLRITGGKVLYEGRQDLTAEGDKTVLTEAFAVPRSGNVEALLFAPTDNTWVAVEVDLIEQTTGEVRAVQLLSDYFHGVDGGESWSEGSKSRSRFFSRVPKGTYVVKLDVETEAGKTPPYYEIKLVSGVPRVYKLILFLIAISLGPIAMFFSRAGFEQRRWAESDYGSSSSGGDDE